MKNILAVCFFWLSLCAYAHASDISGLSSTPGLLKPLSFNKDIQLQQTMVVFDGFKKRQLKDESVVHLARFSSAYQVKSTSSTEISTSFVLPLTIHFTHFGPHAGRTLKFLGSVFPDIVTLKKTHSETQEALNKTFENRSFIRQFLNVADLDDINIDVDINSGEKEYRISKAELIYRWVNDTYRPGNKVLKLEINLYFGVKLKPNKIVDINITRIFPTFQSGTKPARFYVNYDISNTRKWSGKLEQLYAWYKPVSANVGVPALLNYEEVNLGYSFSGLIFKNPVINENQKLAFWYEMDAICDCDEEQAGLESVYIPLLVKDITVSGNAQNSKFNKPGCFIEKHGAVNCKWIPEYEPGYSPYFEISKSIIAEKRIEDAKRLKDFVQPCNAGRQQVIGNDFAPVLAFDVSMDSVGEHYLRTEPKFGDNSSWCTEIAGKSQPWIEFELLADVSEIKMICGNRNLDRKNIKQRYPRKIVFTAADGRDFRYAFFPNLLGIDNIIVNKFPKGKYRMTIEKAQPGSGLVCISGIYFRAVIQEDWALRMAEEFGLL